MDLRAICSAYAVCMSKQQFAQLPEFVHDNVIYNSKPPMTAKAYGRMINDIIRDLVDFRLDVEMLVVEPIGVLTDLNGMVSARFRLSHESQSEQALGRRTVFYEHVFFQFTQGKIAEIWPLIAWPGR
ncbi:uncharacterized protein A1O9_00488 [Exophiala aquamarina CBS 119918]|uniref:SnoaL-like domain-containing protein n=1 Tax=Exophiala aquamarina CBS 119918 TaxID=1182545 RepID=A0A072Q3N2_9EURO|nr:uncharacterized protein A1O9_00488 [Exophiala aquamarina CBS 119918]KEF62515.1 hypothetical protein A1O9_00488 [Exophiala aquamarina CBS 119918]